MNSINTYFKLFGFLIFLINSQIIFSQNINGDKLKNDSMRICSEFGENSMIKKNRVVPHEDIIRMEYEILDCVINSPQFTLINKLVNQDTCFFYVDKNEIPESFILLQKKRSFFCIKNNNDMKYGTWFVGDIYLFPFIENQTKVTLFLTYYYDTMTDKEINIEVIVENKDNNWKIICFNIYSWE